jgi:hypothetical protein
MVLTVYFEECKSDSAFIAICQCKELGRYPFTEPIEKKLMLLEVLPWSLRGRVFDPLNYTQIEPGELFVDSF